MKCIHPFTPEPVRVRDLTSKRVFMMASIVLIAAIGVGTSLSEALFFRSAIVERESHIIDDVVDALMMNTSVGVADRADLASQAQGDMARRFGMLRNLPGVVRVKVFDGTRTIVWSDDPALVGTKRTAHPHDLELAFGGQVRAMFSQSEQLFYALGPRGPTEPVIEFYVPFSWSGPFRPEHRVDGVVAIYRSPEELNDTLLHGMILLWLVTAVGGAALFLTLFVLYRKLYERHVQARSALAAIGEDQERIIQVEKLSAMGQMVAEIAHQLNNPLVGVVNLAELAEREIGDPARSRELLQDVQKAGRHCRDFVQRMLRLAAPARSDPKRTDVVELARETAALFEQSHHSPPSITVRASAEHIDVELDAVLIRHALFNLLSNAAQAMPQGAVRVSIAPQLHEGHAGCAIEVRDNGPGFSREVAAKLFTPFFTTRQGGTGLGLLVARQIAMRHGGNLFARSRDGEGATFTIWLPLAPQPLPVAEPQSAPA